MGFQPMRKHGQDGRATPPGKKTGKIPEVGLFIIIGELSNGGVSKLRLLRLFWHGKRPI
jgi:hypothetical protein